MTDTLNQNLVILDVEEEKIVEEEKTLGSYLKKIRN